MKVIVVVAIFGMLLALSYREITIMEMFNKQKDLENQLASIQKENGQVEKSIKEEESTLDKYEKVYDKKRILLIDDSEASEKLIRKMLNNTNIEIEYVSLGKEGLDKIRNKEKYDLILLDEEMEPLDGIVVMKKLKEVKNFNTKVILLTRNNEYEYNEEYKVLGFTDYLLKPIVKEKLIETIDKYLNE